MSKERDFTWVRIPHDPGSKKGAKEGARGEQGHSSYFADVDTQSAVAAGTRQADKDAQVPGCPGGIYRRQAGTSLGLSLTG